MMCVSIAISVELGLGFKHLSALSYLLFPNGTQELCITEGQVGSKPHGWGASGWKCRGTSPCCLNLALGYLAEAIHFCGQRKLNNGYLVAFWDCVKVSN